MKFSIFLNDILIFSQRSDGWVALGHSILDAPYGKAILFCGPQHRTMRVVEANTGVPAPPVVAKVLRACPEICIITFAGRFEAVRVLDTARQHRKTAGICCSGIGVCPMCGSCLLKACTRSIFSSQCIYHRGPFGNRRYMPA